MTEQQLREALSNCRADLEAGPGVRRSLRDRREALLLTGSVKEVLAQDFEIRVLEIKLEIAAAKAKTFGEKLAHIDHERMRWSGVEMPSDLELKELLVRVEHEHPGLLDRRDTYIARDFAGEFKRAFFGVGSITRLSEPTSKITFETHCDRLNGLLRRHRHTEVEGDVILAAVIAWGDCDYRLPDPRFGQLAECSLDPLHNSGRAPSPVWREVLAGRAPLRQALSPRGLVRSAQPLPQVKIFQENAAGRMVESETMVRGG
jgi:hypothetical protein